MEEPDVSRGVAGPPRGGSPDSSSSPGAALVCPQCPTVLANEASLTAHMLTVHRVHLVVTKDAMAVGQVSTLPLSSTASSLTASPKDDTSCTVCPVCRLQVDDLSRHFAAAHTSKPASPVQSTDAVSAAAVAAAAAARVAAAARIADVTGVHLPNHPLPATALTASDLQQKLLNLKEETKVHVSNLHSTMLQGATKRKANSTTSKARGAPAAAAMMPVVTIKTEEDHCASSTDGGSGNGSAGEGDMAINLSVKDGTLALAAAAEAAAAADAAEAADNKRRRKQTSVPDQNKDQRYWARRLKNNQAAKRSRDMRIQREKIIFDENSRLENDNKELRRDVDQLTTDNKELRLKMDFILEENERLKAVIQSLEAAQQQHQ